MQIAYYGVKGIMQLRQKFFLVLSLLTAIPLLILLFGVVDRMEAELRVQTEKELHVALDKMADEIMLIIENQTAIARGLAHVPALRQFSILHDKVVGRDVSAANYQKKAEELEQFFLNYAHVVPAIQALRFIDVDGKTLVKVKEGKIIEPKFFDDRYQRHYVADQSSKNFFKYTAGMSKDVVMSDFELGQVPSEADFCPAMIRYAAKVESELAHREGFLVINMWGKRLDSTVEASLGGYPGNAFIIEVNEQSPRDGIYLYHKDDDKRFGNQLESQHRFTNAISPQQWQQIKQTKQRGSLYLDDGRMFFFRTLAPFESRPNTQWLLLIEADSQVVFSAIDNMRESIWWLLAVALVISLLLSVWAAYKLTKPVHSLANVITRYADGETNIRCAEDQRDEIGIAGRAFNYLTNSLQRAKEQRDKAEKVARQSERLASVGQLAAGIGHEINNPLMNIMSLASLIEESIKDKEAQADIQLLKKEGERCARIVQGILSFSRKTKPDYQSFNMTTLIQDTLSLLHHRIESAEITTITDLHSDLYLVGDANQLQQVLVNVILNAVQASKVKSCIEVKAYRDDLHVSVEIIDSGTGIQGSDVTKVFDPFFTTKSEGTGLGLSVSYGIIKHHGGTIQVKNNADAGLRVIIQLPIKPSPNIEKDQVAMEVQNVV